MEYSAGIKNDTVDKYLSVWKDVHNIFQREKKQADHKIVCLE